MNQEHVEFLRWLLPGLEDIPMSSAYWAGQAERYVALSTQDRDVYPVIDHTRGRGVWMYDLEGNEYLDMTSGVAVRALGFRPDGIQEFEERLGDVAEELPGHDFDNIPEVLLARRLAGIAPGDFDKHVFFTTSGARAVETAIKSAIDLTGRTRFVAFRPAFHGRTGYALALTASKAVQKEGYPQSLAVTRTPYAYPYRCPVGSDPAACAEYALQQLRDAIADEGRDIAAIVVESLAGEGGIIVPPDDFLRGLRQIADDLGALLVADEVQAGLGRTGTWWAIEHSGVVPDLICSAKALGGGIPMGATIGRAPMFTAASRHSETFSAEPRAALLALFTLKQIEERNLMQNAAEVGDRMMRTLRERLADCDSVGEVRGRGFMMGVEFVEDRRSRRHAVQLRDDIIKNCIYKQRLWVLGSGRSTIRFLPALTTSEEEAMEAVDRFVRAVAEETGAGADRRQTAVAS
jgi:4-aminobutyrate aminotransferase